MKQGLLLLLFVLLTSIASSQSVPNQGNNMSWIGVGLSKELNDKFSLNFFQTHSFNLNDGFRPNFIQPSIDLSYSVNNFSFYLGTKPTFSIDTIASNQALFHRFIAGVELKFRLNKRFRGDASLNFEHHFTERSKFQQRYFLRLDLYYRDTKLPLRFRPFFNQKLYWYSGGRPLQYYDEQGNRTELVPTNGLHAYRWRLGFKVYPKKNVIVAAFFEQQKEFNTSLFGTNPINDLNPNSGSIRRRFYDYSVLGAFVFISL